MPDIIRIACAFLLGYALADYNAERKAKEPPAPPQITIPSDDAAIPSAESPLAATPTTKHSA